MGWLYMTRSGMGGHDSAKAYLDAQFTYERTGDDGAALRPQGDRLLMPQQQGLLRSRAALWPR